MSKVTLLVAVFVGVFAVGIYLWQSELVSLLSKPKEDADIVSSESYRSTDSHDHTETTMESENDKGKNTENQAERGDNGEEQPLKGKEVGRSQEEKKTTEKDNEPNILKGK